MDIDDIINNLSDNEKKRFNELTASEYFRSLYYSEKFIMKSQTPRSWSTKTDRPSS